MSNQHNFRRELSAQLALFDDDAFAALANRGLLRRAKKDLEQQAVTTVEESSTTLTLALGQHRIRFDKRGPAGAQCSCAAVGMCQHILAVAISLQRLSQEDEQLGVGNTTKDDSLALLHSELLAFNGSSLMQYAGKAGYRWAFQFVLDLNMEEEVQIGGDRHIVIQFLHPGISFRYMGGSLDNLISDTTIKQIEKYKVVAVLTYQRAHGIELIEPDTLSKERTASLDSGRDYVSAESEMRGQQDSRMRLRNSVKQLLEESITLGLSHLSAGIHERYVTLEVWARAVKYHRLALLLRRLADYVDLLLERAGSADEHRLLDELTLAYGLVSALDDAAARKLEPAHLVGTPRTQYKEVGTLELFGLGAFAWRSASGYQGLTMVFWSPKEHMFLSCTDARPESQHGFNPIARYTSAFVWTGMGPPAQATGSRILLSGAQLSSAGRLSVAKSTRATMQPVESGATFAPQLKPCKRWSELSRPRHLSHCSLLTEPKPMQDWIVLSPARYGVAKFDASRQTLVWSLFDEEDQKLDVELLFSELTAHAITRIEQFRPEQFSTGTMLVACVRNGPSGLVAEPLSLIYPHTMPHTAADTMARTAPNKNPVDALFFDSVSEHDFASTLPNRPNRNRVDPTETPVTRSLTQPLILPQVLRELRHYLQRQAERGMIADSSEQTVTQILTLVEKAKLSGLTAFSHLSCYGQSAALQSLKVNYLCLQYERLLITSNDCANTPDSQ
ncbi:MAG: hypothetical protein K0R08_1098 [Solimicrobium sp.]|nr:hypothetical protein [Solimicrobium sp.]